MPTTADQVALKKELNVHGGVAVATSWTFDTATSSANPGSGKMRLNNATLGSVTSIYVNDTTVQGYDFSTLAGFLAAGCRIFAQQKDDPTRVALFDVSGAATDNTGWWTIPVTVVNAGSLPVNAKEIAVVALLIPALGGGGGGDNVFVNEVACTNANLDDDTPAAPALSRNVRWQRDTSATNNVSANVPEFTPTDGEFVDGDRGLVPKPVIADLGKILRADGGWAQAGAASIENNAVNNFKLADMPANTVKVRAAGTSGDPSDMAIGAAQLPGRRKAGDLVAIPVGQVEYDQGAFTVPTGTAQFFGDELRIDGTDEVVVDGDGEILVI